MKNYIIKVQRPVTEETVIEVQAVDQETAVNMACRVSRDPDLVWRRYETGNTTYRVVKEE